MSIFTMVMRNGVKEAKAEDMTYMLIGQDYAMHRVSGKDIVKAILGKKLIVTNMAVKDKSLVINNGAADKYLLIDEKTGKFLTNPSPVVINRAEVNDKLVGYTIYNTSGVLQEINVKTALEIHAKTPFANGKIRHTSDGDIIQSIEGNYPVREIKIEEAKDKPIALDIMYLCETIKGSKSVKYGGVMINASNGAQLTKIYNKVSEVNSKLVSSLKQIDTELKEESFKIQRTKTAGFYIVVPISTIEALIKKANKEVKLSTGKILVSCLDYEADKEETLAELKSDLSFNGLKQGSEKGKQSIKKFIQEIKEILSEVKFK